MQRHEPHALGAVVCQRVVRVPGDKLEELLCVLCGLARERARDVGKLLELVVRVGWPYAGFRSTLKAEMAVRPAWLHDVDSSDAYAAAAHACGHAVTPLRTLLCNLDACACLWLGDTPLLVGKKGVEPYDADMHLVQVADGRFAGRVGPAGPPGGATPLGLRLLRAMGKPPPLALMRSQRGLQQQQQQRQVQLREEQQPRQETSTSRLLDEIRAACAAVRAEHEAVSSTTCARRCMYCRIVHPSLDPPRLAGRARAPAGEPAPPGRSSSGQCSGRRRGGFGG